MLEPEEMIVVAPHLIHIGALVDKIDKKFYPLYYPDSDIMDYPFEHQHFISYIDELNKIAENPDFRHTVISTAKENESLVCLFKGYYYFFGSLEHENLASDESRKIFSNLNRWAVSIIAIEDFK